MPFTKCVRIEYDDFVSAAGLLQKGFREVEELVTWIRAPAHCSYSGVREAKLKDAWRCILIAKNSFTDDRKHHDSKFPNWLADFSKMWAVGRGFINSDYSVFVADRERVAGFLVGVGDMLGARVDLIAVDPLFRRLGVAQNLIAAALDYYGRQGCLHIVAGTQAHNTASCKMYESLGFVIGRRQRTFHK